MLARAVAAPLFALLLPQVALSSRRPIDGLHPHGQPAPGAAAVEQIEKALKAFGKTGDPEALVRATKAASGTLEAALGGLATPAMAQLHDHSSTQRATQGVAASLAHSAGVTEAQRLEAASVARDVLKHLEGIGAGDEPVTKQMVAKVLSTTAGQVAQASQQVADLARRFSEKISAEHVQAVAGSLSRQLQAGTGGTVDLPHLEALAAAAASKAGEKLAARAGAALEGQGLALGDVAKLVEELLSHPEQGVQAAGRLLGSAQALMGDLGQAQALVAAMEGALQQ